MSVYLSIPAYSNQLYEGHFDAILKASEKPLVGRLDITSYSALAHTFNMQLCRALNARKEGITHFAMIHSDVVPQPFWLDILWNRMHEFGADMISAVIPIKNKTGLTSTGIEEPVEGSNPFWRPKRLTLHEVYNNYPATFTHEKILLNTGLMLIDITKPWIDEGMWFEFIDKIEKVNGEYVPLVQPEDWNWSRRAREKGAKLYATREVKVKHLGTCAFTNERWDWTLKTDKLGKLY